MAVLVGQITVTELPKQEAQSSYNSPQTKHEYAITGTTDGDTALQTMLTVAPVQDLVNGKPVFYDNSKVTEAGYGCWLGVVNYKFDPNQFEITFDTSGGKIKAVQSIQTIVQHDCREGGTHEPTFERAIGVNGKNVDGVEIEVPKFSFTIIIKLKMSVLSDIYLDTVYQLTGTVNNDEYDIAWKGQTLTFARGELKFDGMIAKQTSNDDLDISMKFSAARGKSLEDNFSIGASDPIITEGWQYLWVQYDDFQDTVMGRPVRKPVYACVEEVYKYSDFLLLGL